MKVNIQKYKIQLIIFLLLFLIFLCSLELYLHFTNTADLIPKKNYEFQF